MNLALQYNFSMENVVQYRRNLPHIHPQDAILFITFLLAGTIPVPVLRRLKEERKQRIKEACDKFKGRELEKETYNIDKRYFKQFDDFLDLNSSGLYWLGDENVARIVANRIHELDGLRYSLIAYTIMSNHVHLLFDTTNIYESTAVDGKGKTRNYPVADTMRSLKGNTSRKCNQQLKRNGSFWYNESYDHYVRDESELNRIINYIINNPVKAGLVDDWRDWKFTYLAER